MAADRSTDPGRWARVEAIFAQALDAPAGERESILERGCGEDAELRAEVEAMLEAAEEAERYFGALAERVGVGDTTRRTVGSGADDPTTEADDVVGRRIGEYEVKAWLGRGGMASVYLAERRGEGFTQRVALKLVTRRISDPLIQRRSNEERRILARLEHRSIARLIDGGMTPDGHAFYAMEYVDGTDLLTYADEQRLSVKKRLELFLEVCAPVQFAHERLVIHCDLKPGNIFVTREGHVKLLDFGVARLMDPDSAGDDVTGLWFTPAYASPEQVRREPPGTASDVYSLGVILYELLTGRRPYRFQNRDPAEVAEIVGSAAPLAPSAAVAALDAPASGGEEVDVHAAAARRSSTPERLRRRLRGDLDAIVMKALAKDSESRYHTAEQLAADVGRHLTHRPVSAVEDTPRYRAAKFGRRHRRSLVAAGFVVVTLAAGVASTLWQAARATRAAGLAAQEAEKAELVASLMADLFRLSDPNEVLGDTITVRDMLDRGTERILGELGDQPVVQAQLLAEVAGIYRNLGLYRRAEPLATRALELRREHLPSESLEVTESMIQLGRLQADLGQSAEAIAMLETGLEIRAPLVISPESLVVAAQGDLAWLYRAAHQRERAAHLFRLALDGQRRLDPSGPGVADMVFGLAATYHDSGMLDEADSLLSSVMASGSGRAATPTAVVALRNVGLIRRLREQYREAEPLLREAVRMAERLYGPDHVEVFDTKTELAFALLGMGQWDEAEALLRPAITASATRFGTTHRTTAALHEALGAVLIEQGAFDEAVILQQLALDEKVVRHENRDHPGVITSIVRVAEALVGAGRYEEAAAYVERAKAMARRLSTEPSVYEISAEQSLGHIAMAEGDPAAAERHFARAVELAETLLPRADHRWTVAAKVDYGVFLASVGRSVEGRELLRWALHTRVERLGEAHPLVGRSRAALAAAEGG